MPLLQVRPPHSLLPPLASNIIHLRSGLPWASIRCLQAPISPPRSGFWAPYLDINLPFGGVIATNFHAVILQTAPNVYRFINFLVPAFRRIYQSHKRLFRSDMRLAIRTTANNSDMKSPNMLGIELKPRFYQFARLYWYQPASGSSRKPSFFVAFKSIGKCIISHTQTHEILSTNVPCVHLDPFGMIFWPVG